MRATMQLIPVSDWWRQGELVLYRDGRGAVVSLHQDVVGLGGLVAPGRQLEWWDGLKP